MLHERQALLGASVLPLVYDCPLLVWRGDHQRGLLHQRPRPESLIERTMTTKIEAWKGLIAVAFKEGKSIKQIAKALSFKAAAVEEVLREFVRPALR